MPAAKASKEENQPTKNKEVPMRHSLAMLIVIALCSAALAQGPPPGPPPGQPPGQPPAPAQPAPAQPSASAPAAIVNGEPIAEAMVLRPLKNVPPDLQAKARVNLINFLIDNLLIDQHLRTAMPTTPAEVDERMKAIKDEAAKNNMPIEKLLAQLELSEAELKAQVAADLRWEKYCKSQYPQAKLQEFFNGHRTHFDGSEVACRHVLIALPPEASPAQRQEAQARLAGYKKLIEDQAAAETAKKTPPGADPLLASANRLQATIDAFGAVAAKESDCPSKKGGGDVGSFGRAGRMVEPFAKAAFALEVGQISAPVETEFGCHLILVTAKTPGRDVNFEEVRDHVFEVCSERLREQLLPALRQKAAIQITPK
jgi:peptidyl-prolyl cis-trans isomerase C